MVLVPLEQKTNLYYIKEYVKINIYYHHAREISSFKSMQNSHYVYGAEDCMKKFCESLIHHTIS